MNLLKIKCLSKLFKSQWFPLLAQAFMLLVFAMLIYGGISVSTDDANFAKVLRNTNLSNLIVWSYWWPIIIVAAILLGRLWCTVCPMELISYLASRIGLRRKVPDFFKSGWVITIFYTLILIVGIHTLALHRIPQRMSLYLLMLMMAAVVVSLIYEKRAFCSYICPVGHLLGLYAFISPFEWRADDLSTCESCKAKDCIAKRNHYRLSARSCTSNLYPATIKNNQDCLLCTQCLKACPYDNVRFSTRWPFADLFCDIKLRAAQVGFILLVSGFVVYEVLSEWPVSKAILKWVPDHLVDTLGITGAMAGFFSAITMFVAFPAVLFLVVVILAKIASVWYGATSGAVLKTFALLLLPTIGGAHIIKSILKMASRIPYWPYVFSDPKGITTAQQIVDKTLVLDKSVTETLYPVISYIAAVILITALAATLLIFRRSEVVKKLNLGARFIIFLGVLTYWSVFGFMILKWRFS
ncbi:MAG: 4Fe-4S binding protein [Planctomycetes bacterium]|nr:4Fe-4S binding protein [Planctomycetota bacterium]